MSNQIQDSTTKAMELLMQQMNFMGSDKAVREAMMEVLVNEHRTIQQTFWRNMFALVEQYGNEARSDGRNEHSVEACNIVTKALADNNVVIPFI